MNNSEKNTYVKTQITEAFVKLLEVKEFNGISICEITDRAQVSRNSFYRNYGKKEDILVDYIEQLLRDWGKVFETDTAPAEQWGSLFGLLSKHGDFFRLIGEQGLTGTLFEAIKRVIVNRPVNSNIEAYAAAFVSYGIFGWVEEWIKRGMKESAEEMTALLKSTGFGASK